MTDKNLIDDDELERLEERLGYEFNRPELLGRALTHSSLSHRGVPHNERLEFLGDSVLETVICEYLFQTFPDLSEGRLSELRSVVVSSTSLYEVASDLALDDFCRVSKGILKKDAIPESIYANLFEAVIAAIYLDGGLEPARTFVLNHLQRLIRNIVEKSHALDYKSFLQQYTQKQWNKIPHYQIVSEEGPDHNKHFEAMVSIRGKQYGPGKGSSKQDAEQEAARIAIEDLDVDTSEVK